MQLGPKGQYGETKTPSMQNNKYQHTKDGPGVDRGISKTGSMH